MATYYVLMIGQSNCKGDGSGDYIAPSNSRVKAWDENTEAIVDSATDPIGQYCKSGDPDYDAATRASCCISMANTFVGARASDNLVIIMAAKNGAGLVGDWDQRGAGTLFDNAVAKANAAGGCHAIIYIGSEADTTGVSTAEALLGKLNDLADDFRTELGNSVHFATTVVGCIYSGDASDSQVRNVREAQLNFHDPSSKNHTLPSLVTLSRNGPTNIHLNANGQEDLGIFCGNWLISLLGATTFTVPKLGTPSKSGNTITIPVDTGSVDVVASPTGFEVGDIFGTKTIDNISVSESSVEVEFTEEISNPWYIGYMDTLAPTVTTPIVSASDVPLHPAIRSNIYSDAEALGSIGALSLTGLKALWTFRNVRNKTSNQSTGTWPVYQPDGGDDYKGTFSNFNTGGYVANNIIDSYLDFDGAGFLTTNYNPIFSDGKDVVFIIRFVMKNFGTAQYLFAAYDDNANYWGTSFNTSADLRFAFAKSGNNNRLIKDDSFANNNKYTVHLAKQGENLKLWINGVAITPLDTNEAWDNDNFQTTAAMIIGKRDGNYPLESQLIDFAVKEDVTYTDEMALADHDAGDTWGLTAHDNGDGTMNLIGPARSGRSKFNFGFGFDF